MTQKSSAIYLSEIRQLGKFVILPYQPQLPSEFRLMEMGLTPGTVVDWIRSSPLGDPVAIQFKGISLSVRRRDFGCICVEQI